jgi:hypothetical protein
MDLISVFRSLQATLSVLGFENIEFGVCSKQQLLQLRDFIRLLFGSITVSLNLVAFYQCLRVLLPQLSRVLQR